MKEGKINFKYIPVPLPAIPRSGEAGTMSFRTQARRIERIRRVSGLIIIAISLLILFGLAMGYSSSSTQLIMKGLPPYQQSLSQLLHIGIGFVLALLIGFAPRAIDRPGAFRSFYSFCIAFVFWVSLVLLIIILFTPLGWEVNNAVRWFRLGPVSFQPSEIVRAVLPLYILVLVLQGGLLKRSYGKLWSLLLIIAPTGLTAIQPNVSVAMLIFLLGLTAMWVAGARFRILLFGLLLVSFLASLLFLLKPEKFEHIKGRISSFIAPQRDVEGAGYQVNQSLYGIARGGLTGVGYLNSLQKANRLPYSSQDFIFSIVVEELGLFGAFLLLFLFSLLAVCGYLLATYVRDSLYSASIFLIFLGISVQAMLNMMTATNLIPPTGINLPFVSLGGTSIVVSIGTIALALTLAQAYVRGLSRAYNKGSG